MHIHKFMGSWAGWAARLGWATQLGLMGCSANQMWLAYSAALLFDWDTTLGLDTVIPGYNLDTGLGWIQSVTIAEHTTPPRTNLQ